MNIDLSQLTLLQLLLALLVTAAVDTATGIVASILATPRSFSFSVVADYLETHVLKRVFPILGLGFLAQSLGGPDGVGAVIWAGALVSLGLYIAETAKSVQSNLGTPSQTPVVEPPPVVPPKAA